MVPTQAKSADSVPHMRRAIAGTLLLLLGLLVWANRNVISSSFATSYTATIGLMTANVRDDARVERAFASVQSARPSGATIALEPGFRHFRNVQVPGPSRAEAVSAAEALSRAIVAAFDAGGPGSLSVSVHRRADAVPGPRTAAVGRVLAYGAAALTLMAAAPSRSIIRWTPRTNTSRIPSSRARTC